MERVESAFANDAKDGTSLTLAQAKHVCQGCGIASGRLILREETAQRLGAAERQIKDPQPTQPLWAKQQLRCFWEILS